jgi:hypothetical protein
MFYELQNASMSCKFVSKTIDSILTKLWSEISKITFQKISVNKNQMRNESKQNRKGKLIGFTCFEHDRAMSGKYVEDLLANLHQEGSVETYKKIV